MNFLRVFLYTTPLLLIASCHSDKVGNPTEGMRADSLLQDSDALVLSLTPTIECLPFYYAQEKGLFKDLGLKVVLKTYQSQFDCDTAMLGTTSIGGAMDLVRLHYYASRQGKSLSAVAALDGKWSLLSSCDLRISKMSSLRNRMISVARFSASDWLGDKALKAAKMADADVFHPQVNNYALRGAMLNGNQLDAAVLPEPYATQAKLSGHRVLFQSDEKSSRIGCLAFKYSILADADSAKMVQSIIKGYNRAADDLNEKGKSVCNKILLNEYKIPQAVIDSLVLPCYKKASLPNVETIDEVKSFLRERGCCDTSVDSLKLINDHFTKEQ